MKNRVPVSELPTIEQVDFSSRENRPPMTWNFELPPSLDTERISVDMRYLGLVHKIGALSTTSVFSEQGDTSTFDYQINGINFDGTATMSGKEVRTKIAEKQRNAIGDADNPLVRHILKDYGKTTTSHILNKSELARLVSDERYKTQQPSEKLWANQLDESLQASIRGAARKHLLGRATGVDYAAEAIQWGVILGLTLPHFANGPAEGVANLIDFTVINRGTILGLNSLRNKKLTGNTMLGERRFSLFSEMQPDRYIALDALTRVGRLVHYEK